MCHEPCAASYHSLMGVRYGDARREFWGKLSSTCLKMCGCKSTVLAVNQASEQRGISDSVMHAA